MTNKELELRLNNIEKAIADLAKKQNDRDNANESSIVSTGADVVALDSKNTALETGQAELEENLAITELTMIENYEAQEEINAQTENALIEIYEMMEG